MFYVNNQASNLKILRCRFDSVVTSSITAPVTVLSCNTAILDSSCFYFCSGINAAASFIIASFISEYIFIVKVNQTSEFCCGIDKSQWSSYAGGINSFAYYHNNHTKTKVITFRSGICLTKYPPGIEAACFCRSVEGNGAGIFSIYAYQTGEMLASHMDLINHTILQNDGLLELVYDFKARMDGFNFVLNSNRNWENSHCEGSNSVTLTNCFLIGDHPKPSSRVIEESVVKTNQITTNKVILPRNSICPLNNLPKSILFSMHLPDIGTDDSLLFNKVLTAFLVIILF